jgi:hypothetical protein
MAFRVLALAEEIAEAVRATRRSPGYGHPVHAEIATGHGPCRLCLRAFRIGEERRLLFTYDAFAGIEPRPLPGPVFIHEAACSRYAEDAGFPRELRGRVLTFSAYARGRRLRAQEHVPGAEADAVIAQLLSRPDVDYLHVRDTEAGCYDFRVERA